MEYAIIDQMNYICNNKYAPAVVAAEVHLVEYLFCQIGGMGANPIGGSGALDF